MPQIILPTWFDTYGNATCAEYLNVGIYANKSCAPDISTKEFGNALRILFDENDARGKGIRATARALGDRCRRLDGREVAAKTILRFAGVDEYLIKQYQNIDH